MVLILSWRIVNPWKETNQSQKMKTEKVSYHDAGQISGR